jgi:hypothetical protein
MLTLEEKAWVTKFNLFLVPNLRFHNDQAGSFIFHPQTLTLGFHPNCYILYVLTGLQRETQGRQVGGYCMDPEDTEFLISIGI